MAGAVFYPDLLASDYDLVSRPLPQEDNFAVGSHPDQGPSAKMSEQVWDNKSYAAEAVGIGLPGTVIIYSRWASSYNRGPIDMNFAATDGSVQRITGIEWNDESGRLGRVPCYNAAEGWRMRGLICRPTEALSLCGARQRWFKRRGLPIRCTCDCSTIEEFSQ